MDIQWHTAPFPATLGPADLHLWLISGGPVDDRGGGEDDDSPEAHARLVALWPLLSPPEQERATRLRLARHRHAYLRAHAGLRLILARYLGQAPERIRLTPGPQGKPAVTGDLEFNLTTSGDLALVAVRRDQPVGVDCERITPHRDMIAIAQRLFAAGEIEQLQACDLEERPQLFTRFWTGLEARVKFTGHGLFHHPLSRTVEPDIQHFIPQPGYLAAIASPDLPPLPAWRTHRLSLPGSASG